MLPGKLFYLPQRTEYKHDASETKCPTVNRN